MRGAGDGVWERVGHMASVEWVWAILSESEGLESVRGML